MSTKKIKPSGLILRDGPANELRRHMVETSTAKFYEPVHKSPIASVGVYLTGVVYEIPLSEIRENNLNARAYYTGIGVDQIGQSMLVNGQEVPARGYVEQQHVILIDGQKRWRGANAVGIKTLRVEICDKPESEREAYLESRRINLERSEQTALDDAVRFKYLIDNNVFPGQVELGAAIGIDQSAVSKILSINMIPDRVKRRMQDYPQLAQLRVACAIAQIYRPTDPQMNADAAYALADSVIDDIIRSEMSARQVEDLVKSRLAAPKKKNRSEIRNYEFAGKTVTVKVLASQGKLDLTVKGLQADKLEQLHQKIQEVLKGEGA